MTVNRRELKSLAAARWIDCKVLFDAGRFGGAYYMGGYAVECALKACVAKQVRKSDFPDKTTVLASYTHDLAKLVRVARLTNMLAEDIRSDSVLEFNWSTVKDWSEESRYENRGKQPTADLLSAIGDPSHGVMEWVKQHW